jgi:cysteine desulfurase family protein (TIGR01976 family)
MTTATRTISAAEVASVEEIRRHFPALERMHDGEPVAYFDGPGGTQVPRQVVDAMVEYLFHHNANTHWLYPTSEETDAIIARARVVLANFLNADPEEIAFGQNMTTLTFHLARGLVRRWGAGDEIVVTELDHHANIAPWRRLATEHGLVVRTVRMDPEEGTLDWRDLERQVGTRTRLVAIGAASNALGTITDVRAAVELARAAGALTFVDAVHYAPHVLVDVREIGCDFLACSAYKFYGLHIGILYGRRELLDAVDVPRLEPAPEAAPERLETGTQNHEGIAGAAAAVEFLASLARADSTSRVATADPARRREALRGTFDALHRRGATLFSRLWHALHDMGGITVYGLPPGSPRTPTLAFTVEGRSTNDIAVALARRGLFVSHGDFYAATVIERLGQAPEGVVRVGCSCYTSTAEIDRLIHALGELL